MGSFLSANVPVKSSVTTAIRLFDQVKSLLEPGAVVGIQGGAVRAVGMKRGAVRANANVRANADVRANASAVMNTLTNLQTAQGIAPGGVKVIASAFDRLERAGVVEEGACRVITEFLTRLESLTGIERDAFFGQLRKAGIIEPGAIVGVQEGAFLGVQEGGIRGQVDTRIVGTAEQNAFFRSLERVVGFEHVDLSALPLAFVVVVVVVVYNVPPFYLAYIVSIVCAFGMPVCLTYLKIRDAAARRDVEANERQRQQEQAETERQRQQEQAETECQRQQEQAEKERQRQQEQAEKERQRQQEQAEKERQRQEAELSRQDATEAERRHSQAEVAENADPSGHIYIMSCHGTFLSLTASSSVCLSAERTQSCIWEVIRADQTSRYPGRFWFRNVATNRYLRGGFSSQESVDSATVHWEFECWTIESTQLNGAVEASYIIACESKSRGWPAYLRGDPLDGSSNGAVLLTTNTFAREKWRFERVTYLRSAKK